MADISIGRQVQMCPPPATHRVAMDTVDSPSSSNPLLLECPRDPGKTSPDAVADNCIFPSSYISSGDFVVLDDPTQRAQDHCVARMATVLPESTPIIEETEIESQLLTDPDKTVVQTDGLPPSTRKFGNTNASPNAFESVNHTQVDITTTTPIAGHGGGNNIKRVTTSLVPDHRGYCECCRNVNEPVVLTTPDQPSKLAIFCEVSSIRGMQKIRRGQTPFIRVLWTCFVATMTCLLTMTTAFLVSDFLTFTTAWHTRTILDHKTEFPAITMCAHNPFSLSANLVWTNGSILTPTAFRVRMNAAARGLVLKGYEHFAASALNDNMETFYANLSPDEASRLSHQSEMFPHCMFMEESSMTVMEHCRMENNLPFVKRRFSHPKYFNCWTIEGRNAALDEALSTHSVTKLIFLVRLVPTTKINEAKNSFVMDTFTRGEGAKLVVHERGTYPEVDKRGVNVQPSRMNELIYQTHYWQRLPTPRAPCSNDQADIRDLGTRYRYQFMQCLDTYLQEKVIKDCGCLISEWPRPTPPNAVHSDIGYCAALPMDADNQTHMTAMIDRFVCVDTILQNLKELKQRAVDDGVCLPRCSYATFATSLSVTSWQPSGQKLNYYREQYTEIERFYTDPLNHNHRERFLRYLQHSTNRTIKKAEPTDNVIGGDGGPTDSLESLTGQGQSTLISLIRQDYDTVMKEERLIFDVYILISRVGGLCSLFIGLTTAVFIEIIEFIYLSYRASQERDAKPAVVPFKAPGRAGGGGCGGSGCGHSFGYHGDGCPRCGDRVYPCLPSGVVGPTSSCARCVQGHLRSTLNANFVARNARYRPTQPVDASWFNNRARVCRGEGADTGVAEGHAGAADTEEDGVDGPVERGLRQRRGDNVILPLPACGSLSSCEPTSEGQTFLQPEYPESRL